MPRTRGNIRLHAAWVVARFWALAGEKGQVEKGRRGRLCPLLRSEDGGAGAGT
jgi:hypothetical protein